MNLIKLIFVTLVFAAIYASAEAEASCAKLERYEMCARWTVPTAYTNGAPLLARNIGKYELRCVGTNVAASLVKFPKAGTNGYLLKALKPGGYSCIIRLYDIWGAPSAWSAPDVATVI